MKRFIIIPFLMCVISSMAQSPYISKVFDYNPAPGQFTNLLPKYEEGDTYETIVQKANDALVNNRKSMICLGGFGGSITFGFDHPITNIAGQYDFQILGNAVIANNYAGERVTGSAEPGIILVSADDNGNGFPDDKWYEIAGSEYFKPQTIHDFSITYYRTPANHTPHPSVNNKALVDTTYIQYRCSDGTTGYIEKNSFHDQDYFPQWVDADSLVFTGTRLANNAEYINSQYFLFCMDYGYADNYPNSAEQSKIDIDWAVDNVGNYVHLHEIQFVKIYTGVNQSCGWIGETSTEIIGAIDLHIPDALPTITDDMMVDAIYGINGQYVGKKIDTLEKGVYIIRYNTGATRKIVL